MLKPFLEALDERVLVCDGAMGTMLYAKGVFINKSFDALNVTQPDLVAEVHQEYVRAGADIVETNTFGANRIKLGSFGLAERLHADQRSRARGSRATRRASRRMSPGAIGPLGHPHRAVGQDRRRRGARVFPRAGAGARSTAASICSSSRRSATSTRSARRSTPCAASRDLPIVAQMTTEEDGNTLDGTPPERFTPELERRGATVIGVNCAVGPAPMLDTIERMAAVTSAGCRRSRTPASRATSRAATSISARRNTWRPTRGASSCTTCGWSAAAAARRPSTSGRSRRRSGAMAPAVVRSHDAAPATASAGAGRRSAIAAPPVAREHKSRLANAMARGTFVVAVELLPPRGFQTDQVVERARRLKIDGVDVDQHPGRPARRRAHQRAVARGADRAAGGDRNAAALRLPRPQPAGHPVRICSAPTRWGCAT